MGPPSRGVTNASPGGANGIGRRRASARRPSIRGHRHDHDRHVPMLKPLAAFVLFSLSAPSFADECEANFKKSGNPLVMTTYSSAVTVPTSITGPRNTPASNAPGRLPTPPTTMIVKAFTVRPKPM